MHLTIKLTTFVETWVGEATPCMTVLPSEERVRSVLRVANVASASGAGYYYEMEDSLSNYFEFHPEIYYGIY